MLGSLESHPLRHHSTFVSFRGEAGLQLRGHRLRLGLAESNPTLSGGALAFGIALAASNPTLSANWE